MSTPVVVTTRAELAAVLAPARSEGRRVGFVPTMGALHEGHAALLREARSLVGDGAVVASIFVNPTQFGEAADLEHYPRTLEADLKVCEREGVDVVFAPDVAEMYPHGTGDDDAVMVRPGPLAKVLEGRSRKGHYRGVLTVVAKLFGLVRPDVAVFGQKDYQQLAVIRRMVRDLNFPIEIVGVPTVREEDGVAMSSRNRYLGEDDRIRARALSAGLTQAWRAWQDGERVASVLLSAVMQQVAKHPELSIDYVEAIDPDSLATLSGQITGGCVIALAVHVGPARLIDNLRLDEPLPKGLSLT